jgi:hypothetical protein
VIVEEASFLIQIRHFLQGLMPGRIHAAAVGQHVASEQLTMRADHPERQITAF